MHADDETDKAGQFGNVGYPGLLHEEADKVGQIGRIGPPSDCVPRASRRSVVKHQKKKKKKVTIQLSICLKW